MIYDRIEELMKRNGLNAYNLSKNCDVSAANITAWKMGKATPVVTKLIAIADYFHVSLDYLCERDEYLPESEDNEILELYRKLDTLSQATFKHLMKQVIKANEKEER